MTSTPFDRAALLDRVDNDWDFLAETVQMLAEDGRKLMADVRQAAAAGDAAALSRSAHALKGMISNFCAADTHARAYDVEAMGRRGDLSTAPAAVQALEEHLESLIAELTKFAETRA